MLAEALGVAPADVVDFECSLYDTQGAAVGGAHGEFLYSSRLDNLASCFIAVEALVAHAEEELQEDTEVRTAAPPKAARPPAGSKPLRRGAAPTRRWRRTP
eukprot:6203304-Prymnesium_polylepis.1